MTFSGSMVSESLCSELVGSYPTCHVIAVSSISMRRSSKFSSSSSVFRIREARTLVGMLDSAGEARFNSSVSSRQTALYISNTNTVKGRCIWVRKWINVVQIVRRNSDRVCRYRYTTVLVKVHMFFDTREKCVSPQKRMISKWCARLFSLYTVNMSASGRAFVCYFVRFDQGICR